MSVKANTMTSDIHNNFSNKSEAVMKITNYDSGISAKLKNSYMTYELELINHKNYSSIEIEEILTSGCDVHGLFKIKKTASGMRLIYESNYEAELVAGFDAKLVTEVARSLKFVGQF